MLDILSKERRDAKGTLNGVHTAKCSFSICPRITLWMVSEDYRYRHPYEDDDDFQTKSTRTHTPAMAQTVWTSDSSVIAVDVIECKGWL